MKSGLKAGPEGTHSVSSALPIRNGLIEAVLGVPKPYQRKTKLSGPSAGASTKSAPKPVKHMDAVVLEVRRLHEQVGMRQSQVRDFILRKGVAITPEDVNRYVHYQTRGALVPTANAAPYI